MTPRASDYSSLTAFARHLAEEAASGGHAVRTAVSAIHRRVIIDGHVHRVIAHSIHEARSPDAPHARVGVAVTLALAGPDPVDDDELLFDAGLTEREAEVAGLLSRRQTNAEIAATLSISEHTARNHVQRILGKLGARSRREVPDLLRGRRRGRATMSNHK